MNLRNIFLLFYIFVHNYAVCDEKSEKMDKKRIPFFRRTVEEFNENDESLETKTDDPQSQLVSYLVKNVKEIFRDVYEDQSKETETNTVEESTLIFRPTIAIRESPDNFTKTSIYYSSFNNLHFVRAINFTKNITPTNIISISTTRHETIKSTETSEKRELLKLSKNLPVIENTEMHVKQLKPVILVSHENGTRNFMKNSDKVKDEKISVRNVHKRHCLYCNNVDFADCVVPKDKLIPSIVCETEGDLCYTQHTPFGIIDRGCYNVKKNLSTYVCSCNLCNHLPISEMPHIFNEQDDWIADIIEMSNTIDFRLNIFKYMSCLKCEVNTTVKVDMFNDANCLEGNIGPVPTEDCNDGEVCAIQSIPSIGYIKRGCAKKPLYNYWLTLCDSDLCNYEPLATIY